MKKCPYCGAENNLQAKHCRGCGRALNEQGFQSQNPKQSNGVGGVIAAIIAGAGTLVIAAILCVVLLFGKVTGFGVKYDSAQSTNTISNNRLHVSTGTTEEVQKVDATTQSPLVQSKDTRNDKPTSASTSSTKKENNNPKSTEQKEAKTAKNDSFFVTWWQQFTDEKADASEPDNSFDEPGDTGEEDSGNGGNPGIEVNEDNQAGDIEDDSEDATDVDEEDPADVTENQEATTQKKEEKPASEICEDDKNDSSQLDVPEGYQIEKLDSQVQYMYPVDFFKNKETDEGITTYTSKDGNTIMIVAVEDASKENGGAADQVKVYRDQMKDELNVTNEETYPADKNGGWDYAIVKGTISEDDFEVPSDGEYDDPDASGEEYDDADANEEAYEVDNSEAPARYVYYLVMCNGSKVYTIRYECNAEDVENQKTYMNNSVRFFY